MLTVLLVSMASTCWANSDNEHAAKIALISGLHFSAVAEKYERQIIVSAILDICNLSGLSDALEIDSKDITKILYDTYDELSEDQKLSCKEGCDRELKSLRQINRMMLLAFSHGYMTAERKVVKRDPSICLRATQEANEILSVQNKNE